MSLLLSQPVKATTTNYNSPSKEPDLPVALEELETFDDLPFEQRRQAFREEVERGPRKTPIKISPQKYNLFIR